MAQQAAEFTLHCFAQSGNCYKPALFLELAGADWTPRFVDYFGGETRSPAYRELNVMGEAPMLEHLGMRLTQSGVILEYLAQTLGRFGPEDDAESRDWLARIEAVPRWVHPYRLMPGHPRPQTTG